MKYFLTFLTVMLLIVALATTATAADSQRGLINKATVVDEVVQAERPQQDDVGQRTVYPLARTKGAAMSGDFTIGVTGADYETFAQALTALKTNGMSGDVNLLVQADYNAVALGETFPITFYGDIPGSGTYKITVKPKTGETAIISGNHSSQLVRIDSISNVYFDGNNGTSNFNLTIINTGTIGTSGRSVLVVGGAQYIEFKNMRFRSAARSTVWRNVEVSGSNRENGGVKDCSFDNCLFYDNGEGIPEAHLYVSGWPTDPTVRVSVKNSKLYNFNGLGTFHGAAIMLRFSVENFTAENNEIYNEYSPTATETGFSGIWIGGSTDRIKNIILKNNIIRDLTSTVTGVIVRGIHITGPTTSTAGIAPENFTIDGNTISNIKAPGAVPLGIRVENSGLNFTISNNNISDIGGGGLQPTGIRVALSTASIHPTKNFRIFGNTIDNIHNSSATASWTIGIHVWFADSVYVYKNKISNISSSEARKNNVGIGCWGAAGKTFYYQFANNFISLPAASSIRSDFYAVGILDYSETPNIVDYYYNSVYIGGTNFDHTETSNAYDRWVSNTSNVKNNIFYNARGGLGKNYAVGTSDSLGANFASNHNDIFSLSDTLGYVRTGIAPTLADWQTLTGGQDMNSISEEPTYKSPTDLHIKTGTATGLMNAGTPVAVLDDIDGEPRHATTPDIGADEFTADAPGAFALLTPANNAINVPINGTLTWEASQYAYSYDVYLGETMPATPTANVTGTSYPYAGLTGNTSYVWKVVAKNDIGTLEGTGSPFGFTTAALPPVAPSDVAFNTVTTTSMNVTWADNSDDEDGFKIYRSTLETSGFTLVGTVGADVTTFAATGLSPNIRYYFRVTAYHTIQGESDFAAGNKATLANTPDAPFAGSPTLRSMRLRPGTAIPDGNPPATLYAIYTENDGGKWVTSANTLGDVPVWRTKVGWGVAATQILNLDNNTSYVWKAKARNLDNVETDFSLITTLATLPPFEAFPITEGFDATFPPTDWQVIDVAGDGTGDAYGSWYKATTLTYKGTGAARYLYEATGTNPGDDWLFNVPMKFTAGTKYILSFYVLTNVSFGPNEKLKVTMGNAPTPSAQTIILADYNPLQEATYAFKGIVFDPPSTGTYYIGFHAYSDADQWFIRLDEVKVAVANPTDIAFLTLTQTTGLRPMKVQPGVAGEKVDLPEAVVLDHSMTTEGPTYKVSDISTTRLVTDPVNTSYKLAPFVSGNNPFAESDKLNPDATPSTVNVAAVLANIGVNPISPYPINWQVEGISQPPVTGNYIPTGGSDNVILPYVPSERGMFDLVAAADVSGEGDRSNDTGRVSLMVYPTPSYNIRYDNYSAQWYIWGTPDPNPAYRIVIGTRFTNPVRGRVAQIDIHTNAERRVGGVRQGTIVPEVWRVRIRAAGPDTNAPGPILYEKKFSGPKYNTLATTLKTMAFGDDAPVIDAGQDYWITVMAESIAVTTGGYPFGLYSNANQPGAITYLGRSYGSSVEDESVWYDMGPARMGAGDWGHWPLRAIMVPVSNSISGVVYEDKNGNGTQDPGEPGLEGWEVKITGNLNLTRLTDANGAYSFNDLENGTFTLSQTTQSGWACITPGSGASYTVTLSGSESVVRNFGNFKPTTVSGIAWVDLNHNAVKDPGEVGKDGVVITLTDGVTPRTATTAGGGLFTFANVFGGSFTLSAAAPPDMYQTYPATTHTFEVVSGTPPIVRDFGLNSTDDLDEFRTFVPENIVALNLAGKLPKAVKSTKPDKVEIEIVLIDTLTAPKTGLYIEYGAAPFATTDPKYPGQVFPAQVVKVNGEIMELGVDYTLTGAIDGKNKKFTYDFTLSGGLVKGDTVSIHGFVKANKPIKAKYWWMPLQTTAPKDPKYALVGIGTPRLPAPNHANLIDLVYATGGLIIGTPQTPPNDKLFGWFEIGKAADVQKSLRAKEVLHTGDPRFFDVFTNNNKPFVKRQKSLPPTKHNNKLFAELVALKLAIDASRLGYTPGGFGELIYEDTSSAYAAFHGKKVKVIADSASAAMTAEASTMGDAEKFHYVVRRINEAFNGGPVPNAVINDTVSFSTVLKLKGVRPLKDVPYLIDDPTSQNPQTIVPAFSAPEVPSTFSLEQNYPNPFNPTTTIEFNLPEDALVTLKVYNVLGQEVATLLDKEFFYEGKDEVTFDAGKLASGIYFYRIVAEGVGENAGKYTQVKKMILMK